MKRETSFTNLYGVEASDKRDTEFSRMEKKIKEHLSTWKNLKKIDKLRMIDKYVLSLDCDFEEKKKDFWKTEKRDFN